MSGMKVLSFPQILCFVYLMLVFQDKVFEAYKDNHIMIPSTSRTVSTL